MRWIPVTEALPEIPKGKYGLSVLVCEWDCTYQEFCEKHNDGKFVNVLRVREVSYASTLTRDGKKMESFHPDSPEFNFMQLEPGMYESTDWVPPDDKITHWMYMPKPPAYDVIWNEEKDRYEFVYHALYYCENCEDTELLAAGQGKIIEGCLSCGGDFLEEEK